MLEGVRQVDGDLAAAILLTLLEEDEASAIVATFAPDEMKRVGAAMLGVSSANAAEIETALDLFVSRSRDASGLGLNAAPRVHRVFAEAVGAPRADNILATIAPRAAERIAERLRWLPDPALAAALSEEHPQIGALILSCLPADRGASTLQTLDEERQCDLLFRAASLAAVGADALRELESILDGYADVEGRAAEVELPGRGGAAKIVTRLPKATNQRLLKGLKKRDKQLAEAIEESLLVFDDLAALDAKNLGILLRAVDGPLLALALRGAASGIVDKMLSCLSARAADTIRDEIAEGAPVKRAEVEEAQRQIAAIARGLADDGELMLTGADDYV